MKKGLYLAFSLAVFSCLLSFCIPAVSFADEPSDDPPKTADASTAPITAPSESSENNANAAAPEAAADSNVTVEVAEAPSGNEASNNDVSAGPEPAPAEVANDPAPASNEPEPSAAPAPAEEAEPATPAPTPTPAVEENPQVAPAPAGQATPAPAAEEENPPASPAPTGQAQPSIAPSPAEQVEPSTAPAPAVVEEEPSVVPAAEMQEAPAIASSPAGQSAGQAAPLLTSASSGRTVNYTINFDVSGTPGSYYDPKTRHGGSVTPSFNSAAGKWSDGTTGIRSFTGTITVDPMTVMYSATPLGFPGVITYSTSDVSNPLYTLREWVLASWSCDNVYLSNNEYYSDTVFFYYPETDMKGISSWGGSNTTFYVYSRTASTAQQLWNNYVSSGGDASHPPSDYIAWVDSQTASGGVNNYGWQSAGISVFLRDSVNLTLNLVPIWTPAVTFDSNGGEGTLRNEYGYDLKSNVSYQVNEAMYIVAPQATLTRDGYIQTGWNTDPNGHRNGSGTHYDALQEFRSFSNLTLYAEWDANAHYSVVYWKDSSDSRISGSLPTSSGISEDGSYAIIQPNELVRDGYKPNGWNTKGDASGTHYAAGERVNLTSNLALVPEWIKTSYNIYFNSNGGSGSMDSMSMTNGQPKALTKNTFTRNGYDFAGWAPSSSPTVATYTDGQTVNLSPTGNVYLYAIWRPSTLSFSYNADDGTGERKSVTGLSANSVLDIPDALPSKNGSLFEGWYFDVAGTDESVRASLGITAGEVAGLSSSASYTLTAHWAEIPYSITYDFNGATDGAVSAKLAIAGSGQRTVAPNTLIRNGATAAGWNTQANGGGIAYSGGELLELESNLTLYAQFTDTSGGLFTAAIAGVAPNSTGYTVLYNLNGGSGSLADNGAISSNGLTAVLAFNSMSRAGYRANGWNTKADGSGTAYADADTISLNNNLVLYAAWTAATSGESGTSGKSEGDSGNAGSDTPSPTQNNASQPKTDNGDSSTPQDAANQSDADDEIISSTQTSSTKSNVTNKKGIISGNSASSAARTNTAGTSGTARTAQAGTASYAGTVPLATERNRAAERTTDDADVLKNIAKVLSLFSPIVSPEKAYASSAEVSDLGGLGEPQQSSAANNQGPGLVLLLDGIIVLAALAALSYLVLRRRHTRS